MLQDKILRALDRALIQRQKTPGKYLLYEAMRRLKPWVVEERLRSCVQMIARRRVAVISSADQSQDLFGRMQGGDYWAAYELTQALGQLGYFVTGGAQEPDVVIHLFGGPAELPEHCYKIIWIYSHPERVTKKILRQYDRIFCLSRHFTQNICHMGFNAEYAPGATSRSPVHVNEMRYDIVFVGNCRAAAKNARWIVNDLGEMQRLLTVWGRGWDDILPPAQVGGQYYDYTRLQDLYSAARISLGDHSPEMREQGFVALRTFDILASGGFCISDANTGLAEIFGDSVPAYQSPVHLQELVRLYLSDPAERRKKMLAGQEMALKHTWIDRARQFMRGLPQDYTETKPE